ncbi:MAG: PQQ-like beta-propeller repeat protein [Calditrichae bacterium]|nr:PQQ-like beta-propeller repeat protein [Calditrichia bacterium]
MRYIHPSLVKILIFFFFCPFSFVLISCSDTGTEPQPKPAGYQEDIPWPSLADSPWPMYRGNPQCTGRSTGTGPFNGAVAWTIDSIFINSGVALAEDGTIYLSEIEDWEKSDPKSGLVALNPDGSLKWRYNFPAPNYWPPSSPVVAKDGTVYVSSPDEKKFYAVNPDGTLKWQVATENHIIQTGINIGRDGTVYAIGYYPSSILYAISKEGKILWTYENSVFSGNELDGMSFSPDGETLYIPGLGSHSVTVFAFDVISRTIKWQFGERRVSLSGTPLVDSQGNIYVIGGEDTTTFMYSLNQDGTIRWKQNLGHIALLSGFNLFAVDEYGKIYTGLDKLICIDYSGEIKWRSTLGGVTLPISSPISIDRNNSIYFTSNLPQERYNKQLLTLQDTSVFFNILSPEPGIAYPNLSIAVGYSSVFIPGRYSRFLWTVK